ncbi:MAG: hypothetical protein H0V69_11890 [Acidimicrobiia bacterium]|nr:hypothetical protein [Acidimicrobiia bacterium]
MRTLLIIGTLVEIALVIGALAVYLVLIARSLRATSALLGKVTFGVRAIETQCQSIGPSVIRINGQLGVITGALDGVAGLAEAAAGPAPAGRPETDGHV